VLRLAAGVEVLWWIGAEDRWYEPAVEITARHSLVGAAPVVRTAIRVPGGDVVATAAAQRQGARDVAVLDVVNESPTPVALAYVLRGPGVVDVSVERSTIRVGGRPILTVANPSPVLVAVGVDEDLLAAVRARRTIEPDDMPTGALQVAVLVPLTHRTRARAAVLIGADSTAATAAAPVISALRDPSAIAAGWATHIARGPIVSTPDADLSSELGGLTASLLLAVDSFEVDGASIAPAAALTRALARIGLRGEAQRCVGSLVDHQHGRGDIGSQDSGVDTAHAIGAIAEAALLNSDIDAAAVAPVVAGGLEYVQRRAKKVPIGSLAAVFGLGAMLLERASERRAAAAARRVWGDASSPWPMPLPDLPPLPAMSAGADLLPSDPLRIAAACNNALDRLVVWDATGAIDLVPGFHDGWRGQPIDLRSLVTPSGPVSMSIRWHGDRPALLWENDDAGHDFAVRCSSLDATFLSREHAAEALLSGVGRVS
jgi:hypothetical protein